MDILRGRNLISVNSTDYFAFCSNIKLLYYVIIIIESELTCTDNQLISYTI